MPIIRWSKLTPLGAAALAVVVAACGGSAPKTTAAVSNQAAAPASSNRPGAGTRQGPPGISGTVAQVTPASGSTPLTLEVQGSSGQTTVFLTSATVVTQTVGTTSGALQIGRCVSATGTKTASGGVQAANVVINLIDTSGNCAAGPGAGAGGPGRGGGFFRRNGGAGSNATTRPTLSPAQRQALAKLAIAAGKILSLDPSTSSVTLQVPAPASTATAGGGSSRPRFNVAGSFTWTSSTRFSETEAATIGSVALNDCVTAFGSSNSTGQVTATRVAVRPPVNGSCTTGSGAGFGFGRFAGAGTGAGAGAGAAG